MRDTGWVRCPNCDEFVQTPDEDQIAIPLFFATCRHCGFEFDWRLTNQEHLRGALLHWEEYINPSELWWDHEHARCVGRSSWSRSCQVSSKLGMSLIPMSKYGGFVSCAFKNCMKRWVGR